MSTYSVSLSKEKDTNETSSGLTPWNECNAGSPMDMHPSLHLDNSQVHRVDVLTEDTREKKEVRSISISYKPFSGIRKLIYIPPHNERMSGLRRQSDGSCK